MKIAVPQVPIFYNDWCNDCLATTHHYIVLMAVNFRYQQVKFYYYCNECYRRDGNSVTCYIVTVPVGEWKKLVGDDFVSDN